MNGTEVQWEFECEGMGAWLRYDFKWAKEFSTNFAVEPVVLIGLELRKT